MPEIVSDSVVTETIMIHLLNEAWGLIANASGGNWSKETPEWQERATQWRDRWVEFLKTGR